MVVKGERGGDKRIACNVIMCVCVCLCVCGLQLAQRVQLALCVRVCATSGCN
jgi:hypothetical protein